MLVIEDPVSAHLPLSYKPLNRNEKRLLSMIALMVYGGYGHGARNVYDQTRFRQEIDRSKLQGSDHDECYGRSGMSYDEYQRQLKERPQGR